MRPRSAEAAAVSGLQSQTLSSGVPERPGKFRGVVRRLFCSVAGACLTHGGEIKNERAKSVVEGG